MQLLDLITRHWDDILAVAGVVAGWLGVRARAKRKQATLDQIARYAVAAADMLIVAVRHQIIPYDADHIGEWRTRLERLVGAAGFALPPTAVPRARVIAAEHLMTTLNNSRALANGAADEASAVLARVARSLLSGIGKHDG